MITFVFAAAVLFSRIGGVYQTNTPWPTTTPMPTGVQPGGIPAFPTSTPSNLCPVGTPFGYGTVTPSALWLGACQQCLPQPTITPTYDPNNILTPVATCYLIAPPYGTPGPIVQCGPTATLQPGPTQGPQPTGTFVPGDLVLSSYSAQDGGYYPNNSGYCYQSNGVIVCDFQGSGTDVNTSYWGEAWNHVVSSVAHYANYVSYHLEASPNTTVLYSQGVTHPVGDGQYTYNNPSGAPQDFEFKIQELPPLYMGPISYHLRITLSGVGYAQVPANTPMPTPVMTGTPTPQAGACASVQGDGNYYGGSGVPGLPNIVSTGPVQCFVLRQEVANFNFGVLENIRPYSWSLMGSGFYDTVQALLFWFLGLVPNITQCFQKVDFATVDLLGVTVNLSWFADVILIGWIFRRITTR